ncbi:HD domain-containing protein [Scatolibacter rhodanostii]|uniref:HD domain-containing protein n=1 Tax=Scatolibacter rhodanostii TaxID=2014781 RepID=UPI000C06B32D|nr:HD domain-containing protein [Scatolibacter rhodanostii]
MNAMQNVMIRMIEYDKADPKRIQHFLKVYQFAKLIGEMEQVEDQMQNIIEIAALVHDIGIKISEEKYGSSAGKYQELEGPPIAKALLKDLGYEPSVINRVCWLVGHHHTYHNIQELDHQILVEADFLVNAYEDNLTVDAIVSVLTKIFRTDSGKLLLKTIYLDENQM